MNSPALPEPFYYLHNFRAVLAWIGERYADLLDDQERAFIAAFAELPEASQALLVRMVMRKGTLFREGKLAYAEIGDTRAAVQPLLALGWVDAQPTLELAQLFGLLKKDELSQLFRDHLGRANLRKDALLERLQPLFPEARRLAEWQADFAEPVYELRCMALCDRLRLMYFGNLWQDWSEFVLADLGIYRYESVEFSADSRGFRLRADVDAYLHLFDCRQRFDLGEPLEELLAGLPGEPYANPWLEGRRVKLLFQFAQHCEKQRDFDLAQRLYRQSSHPGARLRAIRSLERGERFAEAHALAREASCAPESDAERQGLARLLPRLQGKLGLPRQARAAAPEIDRLDLCLAFPSEPCSVEWAVREHLEEPGCAVHYVENGLINSLFGLLCWEAIFAAIPGAFFHPFHSAPADLHSADFRQRRAALFEACLGRLEDGSYRDAIRCRYRDQFDGFMRLLAEAIERLAALDEPGNPLARNSQALERRLRERGVEAPLAQRLSRLRLFGNAPGDYGTGVTQLTLDSTRWDDDSALAEQFLGRLQYAYGSRDWGVKLDGGNLFAEQLKGVQAAILSRSSTLNGVLSTDHPFEYLGGLSLAVRHLDGASPALYIADLRQRQPRTTAAAQFLASELRGRYLSPQWIAAMQREGYAGSLEMLDLANNLWGWQAADRTMVRADQWQALHDTFVMDRRELGLAEWFETHNPTAQAQIIARMAEAIRKGYWDASEQTRRELAERWRQLAAAGAGEVGAATTREFIERMAGGFGEAAAQAEGAAASGAGETVSGRVLEEVAPPPSGEPQPWLRLAAAVLLALFAAGAVRQSVVNRRPMENRS